jgi:hypothetical protein
MHLCLKSFSLVGVLRFHSAERSMGQVHARALLALAASVSTVELLALTVALMTLCQVWSECALELPDSDGGMRDSARRRARRAPACTRRTARPRWRARSRRCRRTRPAAPCWSAWACPAVPSATVRPLSFPNQLILVLP